MNAVTGVAQQQRPLDLSQFPPSLVESKQFQRWWWAFQQRAYPLNDIPEGVKERALEQIAEANARFLLSKQSAPSRRWVNIGPAPIMGGQIGGTGDTRPMSGRVADVAVNPNDPNHWLIGAAQGGIWETKDAGATWKPLTDHQELLAMGAIAFAPSDPRIIYAGTGEAAFSSDSYGGAGLLKSINGGLTWDLIAKDTFARTGFSDIKVDPQNPMIVLAATVSGAVAGRGGLFPPNLGLSGIFKSTDGGMSWRRTLAQRDATDLEVDPKNFNRQYAAIGNIVNLATIANGVYRSTDAGESWTQINGPWQGQPNGIGRIELAMALSNPNILYVSIQDAINTVGNDRQLLGLWRTDNAWAANPGWTPIITHPTMTSNQETQWSYDHELIVDPANENTLYVGGVRLWKCTPCDRTTIAADWTEVSKTGADPQNGIHVDQHAMAWTPSPSPPAALNLSRRTMSFEANEGQTDGQVRFLSRGQGYDLFLTDTEAVLQLRIADCGLRNEAMRNERTVAASNKSDNPQSAIQCQAKPVWRPQSAGPQSAIIRMKLVGANRSPQIAGQNRLPGGGVIPGQCTRPVDFNALSPGTQASNVLAGQGVTISSGSLRVENAIANLVMPAGLNKVGFLLGPGFNGPTGLHCGEMMLTDQDVTSFTVTRPGVTGGSSYPAWRMRAFNAAGAQVGNAVGEGNLTLGDFLFGAQPTEFTISGPGIRRIEICSNNNLSTFAAIPIARLCRGSGSTAENVVALCAEPRAVGPTKHTEYAKGKR